MGRSIAILAALGLLVGCGKEAPPDSGPPAVKSAASQPSTSPATSGAPAPESPKADGTATTAAPPAPASGSGGAVVAEPTGPAAMPSVGEIVTAPVTAMIEQKRKIATMEARQILETYEAMNGERAKSLEEAAKALNVKCPLPPDGWRWKYDPQSGQIEMVKE